MWAGMLYKNFPWWCCRRCKQWHPEIWCVMPCQHVLQIYRYILFVFLLTNCVVKQNSHLAMMMNVVVFRVTPVLVSFDRVLLQETTCSLDQKASWRLVTSVMLSTWWTVLLRPSWKALPSTGHPKSVQICCFCFLLYAFRCVCSCSCIGACVPKYC